MRLHFACGNSENLGGIVFVYFSSTVLSGIMFLFTSDRKGCKFDLLITQRYVSERARRSQPEEYYFSKSTFSWPLGRVLP